MGHHDPVVVRPVVLGVHHVPSAESSTQCIRATNGSWLAGKVLNVSLGTTTYCSHFLRSKQCTNADCTYLHQLVSERDYITKDELTQGKNRVDEALSQRVAFDAAGRNCLPPAFPAAPPPEVSFASAEHVCPVFQRFIARRRRAYSREIKPNSPVHSSLAPVKVFRFDVAPPADAGVTPPVYVFFLASIKYPETTPLVLPQGWMAAPAGSPAQALPPSPTPPASPARADAPVSLVSDAYLATFRTLLGKQLAALFYTPGPRAAGPAAAYAPAFVEPSSASSEENDGWTTVERGPSLKRARREREAHAERRRSLRRRRRRS